jgi:hypothetical protein
MIVWKSWNAMVEDYITSLQDDINTTEKELEELAANSEGGSFFPLIEKVQSNVLYTPWGIYPLESMFKPSDRWDCWIGTTNFGITNTIKKILNEDVEGIEALKILGKYSFVIGVPCTFLFSDVRAAIEKKLCAYTEEEIVKGETKVTVNLVKEQLKNKKYWSILVAPSGKVDYIVSDKLDQKYLEGLNELMEIKQLIGGIILRGDNG